MLKISTYGSVEQTILELEGKLAGPWVQELKGCWWLAVMADRRVRVKLRTVSFIDESGKKLLAEMHREGAELLAEGCMTKAIIEEIIRGENL